MDRHQSQMYFELTPEKPALVERIEERRDVGALVPTEEMRKAKGWIEVIKKPPEPARELTVIHGWLSPEGVLFACAWEKHNELTKALGFSHESEIENAGYCKLSQLKWLVQKRYCANGLTEAQWATIEQWYARNGFPEEHFMRLGDQV
jgi:hypothetical protein